MAQIIHQVEKAIERLRNGGLVAIPTETVYGLAADAENPDAVKAVFTLKGRPATNPLIVHVPNTEAVDDWACDISQSARDLMQAFWPGPLTLVLKAKPGVSRLITAGQDSVAIRLPSHPLARQLLSAFGKALVAPSANKYMSVSPTSAQHVAKQFENDDLLILDGGNCEIGLESTILGVLPGQVPRLLRPGMISVAAIETVIGTEVDLGEFASQGAGSQSANTAAAIRVPGQHLRHYAPATPAFCFTTDRCVLETLPLDDPRTGWILCGMPLAVAGPCLDLTDDPSCYAKRFYDALYQLDSANLERIYVQLPPKNSAWLAIHNRLARAVQTLPLG